MNNTVTSVRSNPSNTAFGSFSAEARKVANIDEINRLIQARKLSITDYAYLHNHRLQIDVKSADELPTLGKKGMGLVINNPFGYIKNKYVDIILTPFTDYNFKQDEFKDMAQNLDKSLKKALGKFKKFDKIETKKEVYFKKHGAQIEELKAQKHKAQLAYRAALDSIYSDGIAPAPLVDSFNQIGPIDKKLAHFHDDEYFEKKQKRIFSFWRNP